MNNDDLEISPVNLHRPLCKIFTSGHSEGIEHAVNLWIKEHPNIYLEQQETCFSKRLFVITLWYTEDSE